MRSILIKAALRKTALLVIMADRNKKGSFNPFCGGPIDENTTTDNTPKRRDDVKLFAGGQMEKDTPEKEENTTKGINFDRKFNFEEDNKDNNIDHSKINFSNIGNNNINDEDLKISIHYEKIRKICDEQGKLLSF